MTLAPALARLERGFRRMWGWCIAKVRGARAYRFDGEEAAHEDNLRQRRVSLSMMAAADAGDQTQTRMASEIENDAEDRLAVLLSSPRLSLAEKRERDAIQSALAARRQGFGPEPQLVRREQQWRPQGFLAATALMGGVRLWMIFGGLAALMGLGAGVQTWRIDRLKEDLQEQRAENAMLERTLEGTRVERDLLAQRSQAADQQARQTAETYEAERARRLRTERELGRVRNAISAASTDAPIDYGFDGVRRDEPPASSPSGSSGGAPAGNSR